METKHNKKVYETPKAEISKMPNDDIITRSSSSVIGPWVEVRTIQKYDF